LLAKAQDGRAVPWRELFVRKTNARLRLLTGETTEVKGDPREALMRWLRGPDQDFFARAMVNRVWGTYFHTGIIHPTDDQNAANPPSNEPLLDYLAAGFVKNKYDLQWVHRQILNSHAYQRAWRPNGTNAKDRRNFSHAIPRRLPAEVVYDAITQACAATDRQAAVRADLSRRAIGHLSTLMAGTYAMRVFGKPDRTTNCDCERSDDPSLLQSILMHNDPLVQDKLNEGGWLNEIAR
jgi:hypothetical protein